jgi:hypothetical protein
MDKHSSGGHMNEMILEELRSGVRRLCLQEVVGRIVLPSLAGSIP